MVSVSFILERSDVFYLSLEPVEVLPQPVEEVDHAIEIDGNEDQNQALGRCTIS